MKGFAWDIPINLTPILCESLKKYWTERLVQCLNLWSRLEGSRFWVSKRFLIRAYLEVQMNNSSSGLILSGCSLLNPVPHFV